MPINTTPFSSWSQAQQDAWNGLCIDNKQPIFISEKFPLPLFLGLSRWGRSTLHSRFLVHLWRNEKDPAIIRWGDTVWGGNLTLLDLAVDRTILHAFKRCKKAGITPTNRTWHIALYKDSPDALTSLCRAYGDQDWLPEGHSHVITMRIILQAEALKRSTQKSSGEPDARRL